MGGFLRDFGAWLPTLDEVSLPVLTGEMVFDAVHAASPSAGGFDGWAGMTSGRWLV